MPDFRSSLKVNQNAIIAAVLDPRTADPAGSWQPGQIWYRSDLNKLRVATGAAAYVQYRADTDLITNADIASNAAIALTKLATDPLARANHTGTQTASTISDFTTVRDQQRLDQHAVPTADVNLGNRKITSLATPVDGTDAANKNYVDNAVQGLDAKASVRVASTAPVTLSGGQTVDGVATAHLDRVLIKDQTNAAENGIYIAHSSAAWQRAADANTWDELISAYVWVERGTTQADTGWLCTVDPGGTLGTTAVSWAQFSGAGQIVAGDGLTKTGNTIDVAAGEGISIKNDTVAVNTGTVSRHWRGSVSPATGATSINVAHGLNFGLADRQVHVSVFHNDRKIETDVVIVDANTIRLEFGALAAGETWRVVVSD